MSTYHQFVKLSRHFGLCQVWKTYNFVLDHNWVLICINMFAGKRNAFNIAFNRSIKMSIRKCLIRSEMKLKFLFLIPFFRQKKYVRFVRVKTSQKTDILCLKESLAYWKITYEITPANILKVWIELALIYQIS